MALHIQHRESNLLYLVRSFMQTHVCHCSPTHVPTAVHSLPLETDSPVSVDDSPVSVDDSAVSLDSPVSVDDSPVSLDDSPVSVDDSPVSVDDSPVSVDDSPVSLDDSPVSGDDSPVSGDDSPVSVDDSPVSLMQSDLSFPVLLTALLVEMFQCDGSWSESAAHVTQSAGFALSLSALAPICPCDILHH